MKIERVYEHKSHGRIGAVELTVPDAGWEIDGVPLSPASVEHLATFALQTLQDAYAGAENAVEAQAAFEKKLDRLLEGRIGARVGVSRDPVKTRIMIIARRHVAMVKKADGKPDHAATTKAAMTWAAKRMDILRPMAERQIEDEKALGTYDPDESADVVPEDE